MTKDNKEHYNQLYNSEWRNVSRSYEVRNKVNILARLPFLNNCSDKKILEIGFGSGDLLRAIKSNNPNNFFVGIELAYSAVYNLRRVNPNFHLCCGRGEYLPFKDRIFDIVICSHVLEHIKDHNIAVAEIKRVLKPNGYAIIAVPVWSAWVNSPLHYRVYTVKSLQSLFGRENMLSIYLKPQGSILTKAIYKILQGIPRLMSNDDKENTSKSLKGSTIGEIYYKFFVPFWLFIDKIDNFFAFFDPQPIQIVGVFKRKI